MGYIIFKDIYQSRKTIIMYLIVGLVFIILGRSTGNIGLLGVPSLIIAFSIIARNEMYEDKNKGYNLLKTLPIKPYKIVISKYLTALVLAGIGALYSILIVAILEKGNISTETYLVILVSAGIAILFASILYNFVYKYGAVKAISYSRFVLIGIAFLPMITKLVFQNIISKELIINILNYINNIDPWNFVFAFGVILVLLVLNSIRLFYKFNH
ncbi:ABC-2 transporter permease [Sporosalibacterium faouarense]|uniref:ABC-2 transporter permease n=1 Tax=Sporosalibacterium faouarense TaxID=516123 RepID=UPI00192B177E|nr:ABC-2 transporter permease [Sporosalibacterium faouarense]